MPFLRPATSRAASTFAAASIVLAAAVGPTPAGAAMDGDAAPTTPVALPPASLSPIDLSVFCPRPTGRWWDDYASTSCSRRFADHDVTVPVAQRTMASLDLGDLPAFATVDIDAIDASIALYADRLAAEAERAAAERAAAAAAAARANSRPPAAARVRQPVPTMEQLDSMMSQCDLPLDHRGAIGEHPCIAALWARIVADMPASGGSASTDPSRTWQSRGLSFIDRLAECGIDFDAIGRMFDEKAERCLGLDQFEVREPTPREIAEQEARDRAAAEEAAARAEVILAADIAALEAGIAGNMAAAEAARQRIVDGATSVTWRFYGWARPESHGRIAADGRHVDSSPLYHHVGSACFPRGWSGSGPLFVYAAPHRPVDLTLTCR